MSITCYTKLDALALRQSAEQRSQETLKRTDEAINRLVKAGEKITFQSVAKAAGVSVAYLYKYDEIKQRIDQLRKQQLPIKGLSQTQTSVGEKAFIRVPAVEMQETEDAVHLKLELPGIEAKDLDVQR